MKIESDPNLLPFSVYNNSQLMQIENDPTLF
jgi:hypothetical protein